MRISSMECFVALAKCLNYTEASEQLFITQSALTKIIQQMEEEMGVDLFIRSRRTVQLTPAGKAFFEDAKKILRKYHDSVSRAQEADRGYFGRVSFACHLNNSEPAVLDLLSGFSAAYPDIHLDITGMHSSQMLRAIDEGSMECVVTAGIPSRKGIESIFLKQYRECVVMRKDHPLAKRERILFDELRREQFSIMSRDYSSRGYNTITSMARTAGFNPHIDIRAMSVPHLLAEVASKGSVTVLSENYRYMAHNSLVFIPLEQTRPYELNFLWDTEADNPCVRTFAEYVRGQFYGAKRYISPPNGSINY